jgi:hypothetical protein
MSARTADDYESVEEDGQSADVEMEAEVQPAAAEKKGKRAGTQSGLIEQQAAPEALREDLLEFVDLCEQIKGAKEALKMFTERKTELQNEIAQYLIQNKLPGIKVSNGHVALYPSKSVQPLNKDYLKETLTQRISDEKTVDEIVEMSFTKRPSQEVKKLRVVQTKRGKGKK